MSRTAFVFPGQGAQYVGMGKDFYEAFPVCREVFETASEATGLDIAKLCFEENEQLNQTEYTQICMLTVEAAILKAVEGQGVRSEVNAGLSLGEYGALIASGVMDAADAFKVVRQRGILMQNAVPTGGAMAAVMAMDAKKIEEICAQTEGIVSIANYNCPGQIVISGKRESVEQAGPLLKEAGARRVLPLNVSGPFHSAMLAEAGEKLGAVLEQISFSALQMPYASNVTGELVRETGMIRELLIRQVSSSVRWQQCAEAMIREGAELFVEIGPGKTLSGFMKKINRQVQAVSIETWEDLKQITEGGGLC